ncbi:MAG: ABC transporter substrate-binding protein [Actinomycetota bacterium]
MTAAAPRRRRRDLAAVVLMSLVLPACAVGRADPVRVPSTVGDGGPVVIASFDFAESETLAQIYAQVLGQKGYPVKVVPSVGSKEIVEPALVQGIIDFVPDYQGSTLEFFTLGSGEAPGSDAATNRELRDVLEPQGVSVLAPSPGENKNEVVVTRATSERFDLREISDLQAVADELVIGGPAECPARPLCLVGLQETYGLEFAEFRPLDTGGPVTVDALDTGVIDVAILFTTNPAIPANDFIMLRDDLDLQPHENVVPMVRTEAVEHFGDDLVTLVDSVTQLLTTDELREINEIVEVLGPRDAATAWLRSQGLVATATPTGGE